MRRSGVCDRAAKIWKGSTQISAGKKFFLCVCLSLPSSSISSLPVPAGKGSQWGGFNRPNPITVTQSRRLPNLVIHISPARVPRSQSGGVV